MAVFNPSFTALSNGLRVLVDPVPQVESVAIGLWAHTGSAAEREDEHGITHLIEHMLFKGTERRDARNIAEEIEGRGGVLNAFTDKEATCYYCRVPANAIEPAIDTLTDMVTGSKIEPDELEREKEVVLSEIARSLDEPSDHVHDLYLQHRWPGHPLGEPIIGTKESVSQFKRDDLIKYMERRYLGSTLLLAVSGKADPAEVIELAERWLGAVPQGKDNLDLKPPVSKPSKQLIARDVEQVHFCIGAESVSYHSEERFVAAMLDSVLGGGMSSRLFQEIREKRGLVYAVGCYHLHYSAGGVFNVYGGTSLKTWDQARELVLEELRKVREELVPEEELARVKRARTGHLMLSLESTNARMNRLARNEMHHGRAIPAEETLKKLNAVTSEEIRDFAAKYLAEESIGMTAIGPFKA